MRTPSSPLARRAAALLVALVALAGPLPVAPRAAADGLPAAGATYVLRVYTTDHALDNLGAAGDLAPVVTAEETDEATQQWRVVDTGAGGGYYQVRNAFSGLCLEVPGADNLQDGAAVDQYRCDPNYANQPNQLWRPALVSGDTVSLTITNRRSGLQLRELSGGAVVQSAQGSAWASVPVPAANSTSWVDLCKDASFVNCQRFTGEQAIPDLGAQWVGNDQVSSVRTSAGATVVLFADSGYRGVCQAIGGEVSDLTDTLIGNDRVSSFKLDRGGCFQDSTAWLVTDRFAVPAARTVAKTYSCPAGRTVGVQGKFDQVFKNTSDAMVGATLGGGGYGSQSVTINFHNWDTTTRQAGASVPCHDGYLYVNSADIPCCLGDYTALTRTTSDGFDRTVQVKRAGQWDERANEGRGDFGDDVLLQPYNQWAEGEAIEFTFQGRAFDVIGRAGPGLGTLRATVTVEPTTDSNESWIKTDLPTASTTAAWPQTQNILLHYSDNDQTRNYTVKVYGAYQAMVAVDAIRITP